MDALSPAPRFYLEAELRPHRSLSAKGAMWLLLPIAFVNLVFATFFLVLGAPIVPPFLGLDVLAMAIALWVSFRSAKAVERVSVTADEINVERERAGLKRTIWRSSPFASTIVFRATCEFAGLTSSGIEIAELRAANRELLVLHRQGVPSVQVVHVLLNDDVAPAGERRILGPDQHRVIRRVAIGILGPVDESE